MALEKWSDSILIGHLAADPQLTEDLETLESQIAGDPCDVILDFAGVRFLNSANIARLLLVRKSMNNAEGRLILCGIDPQIWGTFLVTGLDKLFEVTGDVTTALATLQMASDKSE